MEYERVYLFAIIILEVCILASVLAQIPLWHQCLPDLLVETITDEQVDGRYDVTVTVINDGCAKSHDRFVLVYCNGHERYYAHAYPRVQDRSWNLIELQPGETATHTFSFDVEVLVDKRVRIIEIDVDAKKTVEESDENNNTGLLHCPDW